MQRWSWIGGAAAAAIMGFMVLLALPGIAGAQCEKPTVTATPETQAVCEGDTINLYGSATGGVQPYSWSWQGPDAQASSTDWTRENATEAMEGAYVLTVTEVNGCTGTDEVSVTVNPLPVCGILVDGADNVTELQPGTTHTATVEVPNGTYDWDIEDGNGQNLIQGSDDTQTVTFVAPQEAISVIIKVSVTDENGCGCEYDPELMPPPEGSNDGLLVVPNYIPTVAGWGLIGLMALLGGFGAWTVRRRKRR